MLRTVALLLVLPVGRVWAQTAETNLLTNGSFEFWSHYGTERLAAMLAEGPDCGDPDPLLPVRWTWQLRKPARMVRSTDAHGGQYAISVTVPQGAGGGTLDLSRLEVTPETAYSFGVWAKGKGRVTARVIGAAIEGPQQLAEAAGDAGATWRRIGGEVKVPGHIRLVALQLEVGTGADGVLDDAHLAAPLSLPYDADAVLRDKPARDANTLLLADFDRDDPNVKLVGKAHLTDPGGGRFGRGLRVDKPDMAVIGFKLDRMTPEGTLECWVSPDRMPQLVKETWENIFHYLEVWSPALDLGVLQADTSQCLRWTWRASDELYGKRNSAAVGSAVSLARMRKGQWTHVAIGWDPSAVRLYLDGVLGEMQTEPPVGWWAAPVSVMVGSQWGNYAWDGAIDEIRISNVQRYGPFVPKGARAVPLPVAAAAPAAAAPAERPLPKLDIAAARKELLGRLAPPPEGDYVYEASSARPLVTDAAFALETDRPVAGLTTAVIGRSGLLIGDPQNEGLYWRLGSLRPGRYWVGVLYQSDDRDVEAPQAAFGRLAVYLNGRIVQLASTSDPVQVAPGAWFAEAQAAVAEALKPGDELAVVPTYGAVLRLARLVLHQREPARGPWPVATNFGGHWWCLHTSLRANAQTLFLKQEGTPADSANLWWGQEQRIALPQDLLRAEGGRAVAHCLLANPLPVPLTVDYECAVRGYYRQVAGREAMRLTLAPHERVTRRVAFDLTPDDPGYSIEATLQAINPPNLGWPEADTVAFFPGYRQSMPWRDPFRCRHARRVYFTAPLAGERQRLDLSGRWEMAYTTDLNPPMPPPANLQFAPRDVPFWYWMVNLDRLTPRPHGAYVRRTFDLPDDGAARTARLIVADVTDEATAYVNGQQVGNVRGTATPLVADITKAVRPGKNEVVVVLRDLLAIMDPDYVNPQSPTPSPLYLDAPGLNGSNSLAMSNVSVELSPLVAADDLLVLPSVRKMTLGARMAVTNHAPATVRARVKATVLDARQPVFDLGTKDLDLAPDQPAEVAFDRPWPKPRLWSPQDPHLYVLAVETLDRDTGKRLDLARERFGFRESWIAGTSIYLNGIPVKLKGLSTPSSFGSDTDVQLDRGAPCPDYMDEVGCLASHPVTGVFNSSSKHNVERDAFWETARRNVVPTVKRLQNHPCIVAWDLSNEWLCFLDYSGGDPMLGARRLRSLTDTVLKQDPTRWTFYNGDEDLNGLLDNYSFHYMLEATHPHPVVGFGLNGHSVYFPDGAFWRPLDRDFRPGEELPVNVYRNRVIHWGDKVVMNTENLWKVASYMPPGLSRFVGEDDVVSPAFDSGSGPIAWMWKQNLDGHRDLGCSSVSYYGAVTATTRRGYVLQTFLMPDTVHHGFSGRTITHPYSLHNDLFAPATLALRWRLLAPNGAAVAHGEDVRKMKSADLQRGSLSFALPTVTKRTTYTLDLRLEADGRFVCGEQRDLEVWPAPPVPPGPLARQVVLFDPKGRAADCLKRAGVTARSTADLAAPEGDPKSLLLLIGEDALDNANAGQVAALADFVARGGRVLILAQSVTPGGLPAATKLEPREWSSQPFVRAGDHPILRGVTSWDLHFWAPDRVSARGAYAKPEGGPALPLVDSGTDVGLEWVQLLELYRGEGLYLLCQLPLVASYDQEPMARELLARTLRYAAGGAAFVTPTRRMKAVIAPDSALDKRLRDLGVAYDIIQLDAPLAADATALIDAAAGATATDAQRAAWAEALRSGATVVVSGAQPADAPWLAALAATPVRLTVPPYRMWEGRGYRVGWSLPTAGLSHADLYWKRYEGSEGATCQAEDPSFTIEPLQHFAASADGSRELVFPGALVELPVGKGRLYLDQRRWATPQEKLVRGANRLASSLALGLNVAVAPVAATRPLPDRVEYRPLDLTPFANRALADDVPDDGKGGWSDQGPTADLRTFPLGQRSFGGVPFVIGDPPRSCLVLASDQRPGAATMPAEVTLPVGYPVEGFYFLHGTTYTGPGLAAVYQIQYADGTTADLPLYSEENIRDWISTPGPFPREKGTNSVVAWTGSTPLFKLVAVYRMLWVNPRPETPVKAVRFANPARSAMPILLGLTAVVSPGAQPQRPADAARALDLLSQASRTADAAAARDLLKQALALDPTLAAAHQALAESFERAADEDAALATYRTWVQSGARTPLPYNRIGQILEKRKDYAGALEAYSKSLQVEWNQPPIIEAKARVERLLRG